MYLARTVSPRTCHAHCYPLNFAAAEAMAKISKYEEDGIDGDDDVGFAPHDLERCAARGKLSQF